HQACSAERRDDPSRQAGRPVEDQARGADDGGGRERRHFRSGPDRSDPRAVQFDSCSSPGALRAKGRRTLRRVQRFPFQIGNRAAHLRFHGVGGESEDFVGRGGGISAVPSVFYAEENHDPMRISSDHDARGVGRTIWRPGNPLNWPMEIPPGRISEEMISESAFGGGSSTVFRLKFFVPPPSYRVKFPLSPCILGK